MERLLALARVHQIDLTRLSVTALVDQLAAALRCAPAATLLGQKGDWVVMAAWLVQLRSCMLLPADLPEQQEAEAEADQLAPSPGRPPRDAGARPMAGRPAAARP